MSKTIDKTKFVKWMMENAKVLKEDIEDWPDDFETDGCAHLLEWAAEIIVKYAPEELPPRARQ
jgi:hypothetical protein